MNKKLRITAILSLSIFSASIFADVSNLSANSNSKPHSILDALHAPQLSSLNKDDSYKWLISVLLIGRKVEFQSNISVLSYDQRTTTTELSGSLLVTQVASDTTVAIKDQQGNVVKTLDLGPANAPGLMDFTWDGMLSNGNRANPGFYSLTGNAIVNGVSVQLATAGDFKVKSVAMSQNGVILYVDGLGGQTLANVIKIL